MTTQDEVFHKFLKEGEKKTMAVKRFKAYTPSRRNMTVLDYSEITKKTPEKSLITTKKKKQEEMHKVKSQLDIKVEVIDKNIE